MEKTLQQRAISANNHYKNFMKYFDEDKPPKITSVMLQRILHRQGGYCFHSRLLMLPFTNSPYTISIECINVRLPYLEENIRLVISIMNCTDHSGDTTFWELKGEGANQFLDHKIVHHVSCGWSYQAVKELQDKYANKNENGNK